MQKNNFWLNFIIRVIFGFCVIAVVNFCFSRAEISLKVGFNAISLFTSGFLGLPGVALLYGIVAIPIL